MPKKLYKENLLEGNFLGALHTYKGVLSQEK